MTDTIRAALETMEAVAQKPIPPELRVVDGLLAEGQAVFLARLPQKPGEPWLDYVTRVAQASVLVTGLTTQTLAAAVEAATKEAGE